MFSLSMSFNKKISPVTDFIVAIMSKSTSISAKFISYPQFLINNVKNNRCVLPLPSLNGCRMFRSQYKSVNSSINWRNSKFCRYELFFRTFETGFAYFFDFRMLTKSSAFFTHIDCSDFSRPLV